MPVIPQPSMTTCSLLLLDRREENAVILVGDEVLNAHVVPQRMPLAQLQHALGVSLCRDHCKQHFPIIELKVASGFVLRKKMMMRQLRRNIQVSLSSSLDELRFGGQSMVSPPFACTWI